MLMVKVFHLPIHILHHLSKLSNQQRRKIPSGVSILRHYIYFSNLTAEIRSVCIEIQLFKGGSTCFNFAVRTSIATSGRPPVPSVGSQHISQYRLLYEHQVRRTPSCIAQATAVGCMFPCTSKPSLD